MHEAARRYVASGRNRIHGWLSRVDAEMWLAIAQYQAAQGRSGAVSEIGLHHGKSFVALCLFLADGERAYGIDLFEDQRRNTDASGRGVRGEVEANLRRWGVPPAAVVLDARPSSAVTPEEIRRAVGAVRFFSIDGGHDFDTVRHDLALAASTLAPHGVMALDDFLRPEWPEVSAAYFHWAASDAAGPTPFAIGFNKLYLCRSDYASGYRDALGAWPFLPPYLRKHARLGGALVPVYQRYPLPEWGLTTRFVEYLKLYHPAVYRVFKSRAD